jgi:hypothetical protein
MVPVWFGESDWLYPTLSAALVVVCEAEAEARNVDDFSRR